MKFKIILSLIILSFCQSVSAQSPVPADDEPISTAPPRSLVEDDWSVPASNARAEDRAQGAAEVSPVAELSNSAILLHIEGLNTDLPEYNEVMRLNGQAFNVQQLPPGLVEMLRRQSDDFSDWSQDSEDAPLNPRLSLNFEERQSSLEKFAGLVRRPMFSRGNCGWRLERGPKIENQIRGGPRVSRGYMVKYKCKF